MFGNVTGENHDLDGGYSSAKGASVAEIVHVLYPGGVEGGSATIADFMRPPETGMLV